MERTESIEINSELENRALHSNCYPDLFDNIDETVFRKGLDIETCKQFILWVNIGFTNQLLNEIRNTNAKIINSGVILEKLDGSLNELRKVFCLSSTE